MKTIKGMTIKSMLVLALMATPAFADGDMGGGGFANYDNGTKSGSTVSSEGDMGGGGFRAPDHNQSTIREDHARRRWAPRVAGRPRSEGGSCRSALRPLRGKAPPEGNAADDIFY